MNLIPLLLTVFIDSLGFGLVFPIFSPLVMNDGGMLSSDVSLATRGWIFGFLISAFCIGQFFGGPILGAVSDRKGRKRVLLFTLWLAFVSYIIAALGVIASSISLLFLSRILSGVAAGNYAIAQSIVVDRSEDLEKTKNFGLLGMAWGVGFIVGPYLGGKLADPEMASGLGMAAPFWFAAVFCLINIAVVAWKLKESLSVVQLTKVSVWMGVSHLKRAFELPALRGLFIVMFIFSLGWGFFTEFAPLFLVMRFDFDQEQIGNFYACVGLWIAISQGVWIRPFLKKFSPHSLLLTSLFSLGIVLPLMLLIERSTGLFWLLPLLAFPESFIYPTVSTLVSNLSSKETQGEMLGIHNSIQWAAIGISPMFSGGAVALFPHLPITVGSACMFLAFAYFYWILRKSRVEAVAK